jgi:methyl-accepting chemotaxis protein
MKKSLFGNLSIKAKIITMSTVLLASTLILSGTSLTSLNRIGLEINDIATQQMPLTKVLTKITAHQLEQGIEFERALRFGNELGNEPTAAGHFKTALDHLENLGHKLNEELKQAEDLSTIAISAAHSAEEKKEFEKLLSSLKTIEEHRATFTEHANDVFKNITQGNIHEAHQIAEGAEVEVDNINHEVHTLLEEIETYTENSILIAEEHEHQAETITGIITIVALIVGLLMSFFIIRGVVRGINKAVNIADTIATGDLTHEINIHSTDEVGKLLTSMATMQSKLHSMLNDLNQSSTELAASSEELASVSEEGNRTTQEQQGEVAQVAAAMEEMSSTVQEVSRSATSTAESANNANGQADNGKAVVMSAINSIEHLASEMDNASGVIRTLEQDSETIGSVLDVIKSIAEQTNLLALNAAIEAARAGEQGRGFAVVADEVRVLAQRTQESTEEIEGMITRLQNGTQNAVQVMDSSRELAGNSVTHAREAGEALLAITNAVSEINDMNSQIASATEQQAAVAGEMSANITRISELGEQNAAGANQTTASSNELSQMATHLQGLVCQFKV